LSNASSLASSVEGIVMGVFLFRYSWL
jgi:hypothetical protein